MKDILNKINVDECKNYKKESIYNSCDLGDNTICNGLCHFGAIELFKKLEQSENYIKELEQKLKTAEEALRYYAKSKMPDNLYTSEKINGSAISTDIWAIRGEFNQCKYKVYYDNETAQQTLEKIKEII